MEPVTGRTIYYIAAETPKGTLYYMFRGTDELFDYQNQVIWKVPEGVFDQCLALYAAGDGLPAELKPERGAAAKQLPFPPTEFPFVETLSAGGQAEFFLFRAEGGKIPGNGGKTSGFMLQYIL